MKIDVDLNPYEMIELHRILTAFRSYFMYEGKDTQTLWQKLFGELENREQEIKNEVRKYEECTRS